MIRRWIAVLGGVIGVAALATVALYWDEPMASAPSAATAEAQLADPTAFVPRYVAMARGLVDVEGGIIKLAASRDGIIRQVLVEEGDRVEAGQVLAVQEDRRARLSLRVAEAECEEVRAKLALLEIRLAAAEREQRRIEPLAAKGAAAQRALHERADRVRFLGAEISVTEAQLRTAEARKSAAAFEVEQRTIRAPVDGWIVRRMARPGDGASTLNVTTLFWFVPDTPRIVRAEVEEQFVGGLKVGMTAEIVPEADESKVFRGKVVRIGQVHGPKRPVAYDPKERADVRVVESVLALADADRELLLGQRVMVKFKRD